MRPLAYCQEDSSAFQFASVLSFPDPLSTELPDDFSKNVNLIVILTFFRASVMELGIKS